MATTGKYVFIASMDVEVEKEELFNEVYDQEHVPTLLDVTGVISIFRTIKEDLVLSMGGVEQKIVFEDEPKYSAYYEIDEPAVLVSADWASAIESGRWPSQVRPYTFNRRHILRKIM